MWGHKVQLLGKGVPLEKQIANFQELLEATHAACVNAAQRSLLLALANIVKSLPRKKPQCKAP